MSRTTYSTKGVTSWQFKRTQSEAALNSLFVINLKLERWVPSGCPGVLKIDRHPLKSKNPPSSFRGTQFNLVSLFCSKYSEQNVDVSSTSLFNSTKVKRHQPGKAREWADDNDEDGNIRMEKVAEVKKAFPSHEETYFMRNDDARLRRLTDNRIDNLEEVREDHRRIRQAEIVSTIGDKRRREEGLDSEDEDAFEERRRSIRERLFQRQQEEAALMPEEEEEEESEYETDSEEETARIAMVKLVFVPKSGRDTIAERERLKVEEMALEEAVKRRMEENRVETRQIVVEKFWEDQDTQRNMESEANITDMDLDDDVNEAEEYEDWKDNREIVRIKRDRDDREARLKEKEEIERVRNMTEEERREWERKNPKPSGKSKKQWMFLQKYYHKGSFFLSDPDDPVGTAKADYIYTRDFSAPTGNDKMDKTVMPIVMQVKYFGRSGRTKWTHLVNEDTTDWNNPWTYNDSLRAKYAKMAGMSAPTAKPEGSKKLKDWETR
ncbi:microfibrillar-associated protein 1-like [Olea europaea var. sylvestris]|uniref:microfibrillar-associated protein 1-like n=1 Tax=Olea europaea var. sylvestris TaxID=158386 RepID=UPI000C1CFA90|nr:microfibrillar-associated protein 1-like [Olea europaea var. sylvestris]